MSRAAYNEKNDKYIKQIEELLEILPYYTKDYIFHIEGRILPSSRYSYLMDIKDFFEYLLENNPLLQNFHDITPQILDQLQIQDFNEYLHQVRNRVGEKAESHKITALRSFFGFLCDNKYISSREFSAIKNPKIPKNDTITYLEPEEIQRFLQSIESGEFLGDNQKTWHNKQKERDLALLALMLGTGIRVSECVELDLADVHLDKNTLHLIRKGNKETNIFFSNTTKKYLQPYYETRLSNKQLSSPALFLNRNGERISVRSVQKLVKKYAVPQVTGTKKITPHKLRSTYGENLYEKTGDIYLVADVLGHESVDTTKRHYTAVTENRKREAGKIDILRK